MDTTGFIGTGTMGEPMALNLLAGGYELFVHDVDKNRTAALDRAGATLCHNAREVALKSDILFLMVLDADDVESVLFGNDGAIEGLSPGNLVVCMSSIPARVTREFSQRLEQHGIGLIDAPVSGGKAGAAEASLAIMAGGKEEDFRRIVPLLELMGNNITHVGDCGSGQTAKAANQIIVALTRAAVGEAMLFATRNDVDPGRVIDALTGGLADGRTLQTYGPRIAGLPRPVEFGSPILRKDVNSIVAAADTDDIDLPFTRLAGKMYNDFKN